MTKQIPNPKSQLLSHAQVGGVGLGLSGVTPPPGMGVLMLYVPLTHIVGMNPLEIQADLGLPWNSTDGEGVWFDDFSADRPIGDKRSIPEN